MKFIAALSLPIVSAFFLLSQRSTAPQTEQARVQRHFDGAIQMLEDGDTAQLTPEQRATREALIEELGRYQGAGRFPINRDFALRTPYFVDQEGTRCALAHLMESTGEHALVARIRTERNNARAVELSDDPQVRQWLVAQGITLDEAARIQPTYDFQDQCIRRTDCFCDPSAAQLAQADFRYGAMTVLKVAGRGAKKAGDTIALKNLQPPTSEHGYLFQLDNEGAPIAMLTMSEHAIVRCNGAQVSLDPLLESFDKGRCEQMLIEHDPQLRPYGDCGGCTCITPPTTQLGSLGLLALLALSLLGRRPRGAGPRQR